MEAVYDLLSDSSSYDDDYGLSGKDLKDPVEAIRALHYGVCKSANTDAEKDGDTTYLFMLFNSLLFGITKCCQTSHKALTRHLLGHIQRY